MKRNGFLFILLLSAMLLSVITIVQGNNSMSVWIDIKPGSCPNSINLKSKGKVPVAIMGHGGFDAREVDPPTVVFAGASPLRWAWEDVNDNGYDDLVLHFKTQELTDLQGLSRGSYETTLTGELLDGTPFEGSGWIRIVKS